MPPTQATLGPHTAAPHVVEPASTHRPSRQVCPAAQQASPQRWLGAQHCPLTHCVPAPQHEAPQTLAGAQQPPPGSTPPAWQHCDVTGSHCVPAPQQTLAPTGPHAWPAGQQRPATHALPAGQHWPLQTWLSGQHWSPPVQIWPLGQHLVPHCDATSQHLF